MEIEGAEKRSWNEKQKRRNRNKRTKFEGRRRSRPKGVKPPSEGLLEKANIHQSQIGGEGERGIVKGEPSSEKVAN